MRWLWHKASGDLHCFCSLLEFVPAAVAWCGHRVCCMDEQYHVAVTVVVGRSRAHLLWLQWHISVALQAGVTLWAEHLVHQEQPLPSAWTARAGGVLQLGAGGSEELVACP